VAIDRQEQKYGWERQEGQEGDGYEGRSKEQVAADKAYKEAQEEACKEAQDES
jgi:hypothetical protein